MRSVMSWLMLMLVCVVPVRGDGSLRATDLRCEMRRDPMGVEVASPRLGWVVESERRGAVQSAYRVLVASSPQLLAEDRGDLWDSGRVASGETAHIAYGGEAPGSRQVCYWKVRAWDGEGEAGPWSAGARWEMGLLAAEDWEAEWIEAAARPLEVRVVSASYHTPDGGVSVDVTQRVADAVARGERVVASNEAMGGDPAYGTPKVLSIVYERLGRRYEVEVVEDGEAPVPPASIPYLRRGFVSKGEVVRARIHATALGVYELWLNGDRVGDHELAPGWTDYRQRVQYQSHDVTAQVRQGANTLGAVVAPGWFAGRAGLFHARAYYGETPALLAQLEITYADGSREVIGTDGGWRWHDGPILAADIMDGETFDARLALEGWCGATAAFEKSLRWQPVTTRKEQRTLRAQVDEPVRVLKEVETRAVTQPRPGVWVFDLGQNIVGVARLRVLEAEGTVLTIRHAEMLNPDGTVYTENLRGAAATDRYICRGGGVERWRPRFTFHGFRYVEVSGLSREPDAGTVTGVVLGSDLEPAGTFVCSDPRLNQLQSNIVWGLHGNYLSIPTDCPQRDER
ncbi:MAG: family 78 glycoside hydrolase catalytic domain, partial [Phycisphaerales bacterium]|nr:family 78 glycoside hydrolase catalytic domain [Phycisphaerales bacterium]